MEFSYQARDNDGALKMGTVEANNQAMAFDILRQHDLIVIKVFPVSQVSFMERVNLFERVSAKDIVLFSRQLATLISAKVPIVQALKVLKLQVSSKKLQRILGEITQRIESGESLSSAVARYPKIFSGLYVNLIRSGELSGTLDEALTYLANQTEKDYDMRSKVISAMTYPLFILSALVVVGFLMFIFVLPSLISILKESEVELPFTTKILIAVTDFMQNYWWIALIVIIGSVTGIRMYIKTYSGRYVFDDIKIKVPIFGPLFKKVYMARFARNLATLIAGGIPIVKALDSVADIVGNQVYREIILESSHQVRNGKSIASSFVDKPEFPAIVSQMMQIGETTGRLEEILDKLGSFYEKEVEGVLRTLTTLMEPIIMLLLGVAVAIMVAGILMPIYNLAGAA
jgi:type II secretory pathway component PulF